MQREVYRRSVSSVQYAWLLALYCMSASYVEAQLICNLTFDSRPAVCYSSVVSTVYIR
jgi:hypothetical protein